MPQCFVGDFNGFVVAVVVVATAAANIVSSDNRYLGAGVSGSSSSSNGDGCIDKLE